MKVILVLQTLLIIAAGAYIYHLRTATGTPDTVVKEEILGDPELVAVPTTTPNSIATTPATTTVTTDIAGPNDQGMEWPIFEGELEVR